MTTYNVTNEKYNINFDLKFDTFYNFIDSLKESKIYYYDCYNLENINIVEFDNEYIGNINILKSELLKLYIFITNDDSDNQYIIVDDTIKDIHEYLLAQSASRIIFNLSPFEKDEIIGITETEIIKLNNNKYKLNRVFYITDLDQDFINSININYLTRNKLSKLIRIYIHICKQHKNYPVPDPCDDYKKNYIYNWSNLKSWTVSTTSSEIREDFNKLLNNYLDTLNYESNYDRELHKILINLPNICISHISSKKLLNNISNDTNLIDLNENLLYRFH